MLSNLKVGSRLGLGFGVLLALLCGVALLGFVNVESLSDNLHTIGRADFPKFALAQELSEAEYQVARDMRTLVIVDDLDITKDIKASIDQARRDFDAAWEKLGKFPLSEQDKTLLSRLNNHRLKAGGLK